MNRVMAVDREDAEDAEDAYRRNGREIKAAIEWLLPPDWTFEGKRVLEFGCGAGRVLSAFVAEAERGECHGCDVDAESVAWVRDHLVPPFSVFSNAGPPALPFEEGSLDLIYAVSVFSHLADDWSGWLAELHRCLSPSGYLLVSVLGGANSEEFAHEAWDPDRVGMNVLVPHNSWDHGGPMVFLSRWWLEARWGRAFELVHYVEAEEHLYQDWAVLRKKPIGATAELFERPEPGEERELRAARHNISQLRRELESRAVAEREFRDSIESSMSWRITKPLRALRRAIGS